MSDSTSPSRITQTLVQKGFWLYFFGYLIAPTGYLIRSLVSTSPDISIADVGLLYSIISLITFLNVYNDLGLTDSLQYFLPQYWIKKQFDAIKTTISMSIGIQLLSSLLIGGLVRWGSEWLADVYFETDKAALLLRYFCRYFIGINLFQSIQTILISFQDTLAYQSSDFVRMVSVLIATIACIVCGYTSIEYFALTWLAGLAIGLIVSFLRYYHRYHHQLMQGKLARDLDILRPYQQYALWAFLGANILNLFGHIMLQLVVFFLGTTEAGYFSTFQSLFGIGTMILMPIIALITPMIVEALETSGTQQVNYLLSLFYNYFVIAILAIVVVLGLFGEQIVLILFDERYLISGTMLRYASILLIPVVLSTFNFAVLGGMGKIISRLHILIIATVVVVCVSLSMQWRGLMGALVAWGAGYIYAWLASMRRIQDQSTITLSGSLFAKNGALLIGVVVFYLTVEQYRMSAWSASQHVLMMIAVALTLGLGLLLINWKDLMVLWNYIRRR